MALRAVWLQHARAGAGEVNVLDHRFVAAAARDPGRRLAIPLEPAVLVLIEDEQRLVAQLRELRAPAGAAAHGLIRLDGADDVDLLAVVDLIPDALQDLAEGRRVGIAAIHQPRDVGEADFAGGELFVIEDAQSARAHRLVAVEREVDFLDAEALGAGTELRFGAQGAAAEEDYVLALQHRLRLVTLVVAAVGRRRRRRFGRASASSRRRRARLGSSCFMKSGVTSIASSSSVSSRSYIRPVNLVGIGPAACLRSS